MTETAAQDTESVLRIDNETNELTIGGVPVALRGEDGRKISVDHVSEMDGYVAFAEGNLHLTFEAGEDDE